MLEKNKKKIAFLKNHLGENEGGLEKQTWRLAKAFASKGYEVSLLTSSCVKSPDFHTEKLKTQKTFSFQKLLSFDRACQDHLKTHHYDIILGLDRNSFQTHLRAGNGVHAAYLNLRRANVSPFKSSTFHLNPLHRALLALEKRGFEHPDLKALITNSAMVKQEILEHYNVDPQKIHVIHNGVEWEEKKECFSRWSLGKNEFLLQHSLSSDTYHFLFIGHDFKRKGLDILLEALSLIKNRSFFLSVVGKDRNLRFYENKVEKLGLKKQVAFFGKTDITSPFYQLADCLIIPSFYDPFANVTLEALSMGVFVVTSVHNGAKEILTPETGYVLNTFDKEELSHILTQLMETPKTELSASKIRESVKHLDFTQQLTKAIDLCLA